MASIAAQPPRPIVNRDFSSLTSVFIEWQEGTTGDILILGYKLYMVELASGEVTLQYDG